MAVLKHLFTVKGKPFFPIGGQGMNQAGQSAKEAEIAFKAVKTLNGNTCLIPIHWSQVEPKEGKFNFSIVEELLTSARKYHLKLILLWFATWKNGNMDYTPSWVKTNPKRFKRVVASNGKTLWVLSSHCKANLEADKKAFTALCAYLKKVDRVKRTVIGLQVENEPGIIGSDRDYSSEANKIFVSPIPKELITKMKNQGGGRTFDLWQQAGGERTGMWSEIFGRFAGELFTGWSIATYVDSIAKAGKAVYNIPMHINVWLHQDWDIAGESYPSGGAVRNTLDIYKWFTPHIDIIAPDIYFFDSKRYEEVCKIYARKDNPFYVPESGTSGSNAWLMFRAVADYNAIGYHCFGVERIMAEDGSVRPESQQLVESFRFLSSAIPLLLKYQGTGKIHAVVQEENMDSQILDLDGYVGKIHFEASRWVKQPNTPVERRGRGLIIQANTHEFYLVGDHYRLTLRRKLSGGTLDNMVTVLYWTLPMHQFISVEEGHFNEKGKFIVVHRRCGDETSDGMWVSADRDVVRVIMCD
jgi:hypothetical protein